ncbi:MAG: ATP-binding cassette domain-containing protein [Bacteroidales bacterium]|nr:ATP-binding cassette domain-containing protein [Bacteroidales bacterium]
MDKLTAYISIKGARENNLKNISLEIPHNCLIAVTGISGSGKSSLAFDTIANEGRRQYLESIPSFARQFSGRISQPDVDDISGLYPVISIGQKLPGGSPKSTLGTVSEIYDYLRLLFARFGETNTEVKLSRSLFSFNSPLGACPHCSGLGLEELISINKLIADPSLTLREGALVPTLASGYIMYSQLTIDALDTVCRGHGFSVDIPWNELTKEQRDVVLYGSDRIKVLKGKHTIESRLKWTALKAKPREMGYYSGMINVMEDILRRDRNRNILRFTESIVCSHCNGKRLNKEALNVKYRTNTIDNLCELELNELLSLISELNSDNPAETLIWSHLVTELTNLCRLGIGHLQLSRSTASLSGGELQRVRLVNQLSAGLTRVLYVFDEPSIGMHPRDTAQLISILRSLVNKGNTVIIVEHDPEIIRHADWIIETGPEAGINGGEILYNGAISAFLDTKDKGNLTPTQLALSTPYSTPEKISNKELIAFTDCSHNNLKGLNINLQLSSINVITGVPGAGKSSLVYGCLLPQLKKAIRVDHSPIGRTPRSNPATYTGLADHIRDLFARQGMANELGYKKGRFSFNNKGGRCEKCEGAGRIQIGMHYMGNIDVLCDQCNGKRFNEDTLRVKYNGKSISDIYDLSINQAVGIFQDEKIILKYLKVMQSLGLGYLKLGQSSTTLSGGEAQRIKLATALSKNYSKDTWFILDEPTTGLHFIDTEILITALRSLAEKGNTILAIEHQEQFIRFADRIIDLGPGSGREGGELVYEGPWEDFEKCKESLTAKYLKETQAIDVQKADTLDKISITNCRTNNLKGIDVHIPLDKVSVITGISGSGKSSLAFDTIYSEAQSRFTESLSTYARSFIKQSNLAVADSFRNLTPAVAINRKNLPASPRSTVGTITGVYEKYRFIFSRIAQTQGLDISAKEFSFNHESGACKECAGLGVVLKGDPSKMVSDWSLSIAEGALTHNSTIRYYGDPHSQFVAILTKAGLSLGIDIKKALKEYNDSQLDLVFKGTGDLIWHAEWNFLNRTSSGTKEISGVWKGFSNLVEEEYHRRLHNKNLEGIKSLLVEETCPSCNGGCVNRRALSVQAGGLNIAELSALSVDETEQWFANMIGEKGTESIIIASVYEYIKALLVNMQMLGLGHLSIARRSSTLSGGEGQRLRLSQQLSGALSGMTFILDEPTIGLHQKDVSQLFKVIRKLQDKGNTIIIVEHDREVIKKADHIIEIGPGSGKDGGRIVAQGSYGEFIESDTAITPEFLIENRLPAARLRNLSPDTFGVRGVTKHNLVNRDFIFDADGIIALTGVSGSGKSTLVHQVLAPSLNRSLAINCESYFENAGFDQYITVDHRAIDSNYLSTVASFTGLLDSFMSLFSSNAQAKNLSLKKSAFSYRSKEGRCPVCNGNGKIRISMDFMDDVLNICDGCQGRRYNDKVLSIRVLGLNIADLLHLTVSRAIEYCKKIEGKASNAALDILGRLEEIGLAHLELGQTLQSLSGGESQRLKLIIKMLEGRGKKILFMLDEPSSGLHYKDLDKLIVLFNKLVDDGHTVLFIEHKPYMIAVANQVIEL